MAISSELQPSTIGTDNFSATFLGACGMLGVSLQHRATELLAMPVSIDAYRLGACTGLPLLHPWANRLASPTYSFGATTVNLPTNSVPVDANGLPIHGNMQGRPFSVLAATRFTIAATIRYDDPHLLASFPFPHELTIDAAIDPDHTTLSIATTVGNLGDHLMPISFGWHPYLTLASRPHAAWRLQLPARVRYTLDQHLIPTGATTSEPASNTLLGDTTYDDHYSLGTDRTFAIADATRRIEVALDHNYPHAQIYVAAPTPTSANDFVCIEPMTAAPNALGSETTPTLQPGATFRAEFAIRVT